jgi:hypothetical protein
VFAGSNFLHSIVSSGHISLVSLLLKFGIFGILGKFGFNSDWRISGDSHRQAMAAISFEAGRRRLAAGVFPVCLARLAFVRPAFFGIPL